MIAKKRKITIIGGGSYSWTPMLISNFLQNEFFDNYSVCLMDIDRRALSEVEKLCVMLKKMTASSLKIIATINLEEALKDASYVIVAISHAGLEAELEDHRITRKYGFYNIKGSEVGIAGCSRTLRHVPVFLDFAKKMEKLCSEAMMLNVTNPLTALTRAVNKYSSIKCVGFCHGIRNHLELMFPLFGAKNWDEVDFVTAGIDHNSWLLEVKYKGRDALEIMKKKGLIEIAKQGKSVATFDDPFAGRENLRLRFLIWDIIGYLPGLSDEHCVEFFGQIMKDKETRKHYNVTYDRIKERTKTVRTAKQRVRDIISGKIKPELLRSSEIIDRFIMSVEGRDRFMDVLNVPNKGQIANLPEGSVVETMCWIDSNGYHPICVGRLPKILETIVTPHLIREELYMEAAVENDRKKLRAALSTDPLVNDFRRIDEVVDELFNYNGRFLRFS